MSVSAEYRAYVLEQIARVAPVAARNMFGGVGIYSGGLMFALMDNDALYLKVDDSNRGHFEAIGAGPFRPFGDDRPMNYYELPADLLEDQDALRDWVEGSLRVARRARARRAR